MFSVYFPYVNVTIRHFLRYKKKEMQHIPWNSRFPCVIRLLEFHFQCTYNLEIHSWNSTRGGESTWNSTYEVEFQIAHGIPKLHNMSWNSICHGIPNGEFRIPNSTV